MADIIYGATGINFAAHGNVGGMTSELLDDYEEGTWTPLMTLETGSNLSHQTQTGYYTKVGNMVTLTCYLSWTKVAGTNNVIITGCPFVGSGSYSVSIAINSYFTLDLAGNTPYFTFYSGLSILLLASAVESGVWQSGNIGGSYTATPGIITATTLTHFTTS